MPPHLAHALGHSDDTEAHTSTRQCASNADGAGTGTTPREPLLASARVARVPNPHAKCIIILLLLYVLVEVIVEVNVAGHCARERFQCDPGRLAHPPVPHIPIGVLEHRHHGGDMLRECRRLQLAQHP